MSFIDVFKSERKSRTIYGISPTDNAMKVLILTYLLLRAGGTSQINTLKGYYTKYNRGSSIAYSTGGFVPDTPGSQGEGITETFSRVINIYMTDLSGTGTTEEQIAEYINTHNLNRQGDDAETWVNLI